MEFVGEKNAEIVELSSLHKLFSNESYVIEAAASDIRCEDFKIEPEFVLTPESPNGYYTQYKLTVEYTVYTDSLKITRTDC